MISYYGTDRVGFSISCGDIFCEPGINVSKAHLVVRGDIDIEGVNMFDMGCHLVFRSQIDARRCRLNDTDPTFIVVIALKFGDFYLVDVTEPGIRRDR